MVICRDLRPNVGFYTIMRAAARLLVVGFASSLELSVIKQSLHTLHRPPPGQKHFEVPARLEAAEEALRSSALALSWRNGVNSTVVDVEGAVAALKRVHSIDHLRGVQDMSRSGGGGYDSDTYCAPGSWEAMLDGTRCWTEAAVLAAEGRGPALALCRPAGHHATRDVAMGFGLVNFAAAAAADALARGAGRVAILDWDVHHGNGVEAIFKGTEPRVKYCSLHEAGGFPGTGAAGVDGNVLNVVLPRGAGSAAYLEALEREALPFLLGGGAPDLLLVCAGYDALADDPLATMALSPADFGASVALIRGAGVPPERIALGLEGGYLLDEDAGMPAALLATCAGLLA